MNPLPLRNGLRDIRWTQLYPREIAVRADAYLLETEIQKILLRALHASKLLHGNLFAVGETRGETGE